MSSSSTPWKPPLTSGSSSRSRQPGQPAARPRTSPPRPPPSARNRRCGSRGPSAGAGAAPRGTAGAPATRRWSSVCVCVGTQGAQRGVPVSPQPPTAPRCPRTCRPPWQAPTMARKWPAEQRGQPSAVAHSRWKVQPSQVPSGHLLGTRASRTWGWLSPKPPSPGQCCVPSGGTRHYSTEDTGVAVPKVRIPSATLPVALRCVRTGAGGLQGCSYPQPGPQLWHPPGHGGTHTGYGGGSSHSKVPKDTTLPVHKDHSAWGHLGGRI